VGEHREPLLDGGADPSWEGTIFRGKGASHCKVWDTLQSSVQKRLNLFRCRLGREFGRAQRIRC